MKTLLDSTLVLCDLDNLLLGSDGELSAATRQVLTLFLSRGGKLTVFSQRGPRAVRSVLGEAAFGAPALLCGGTLAYRFADGSAKALCGFSGLEETVLKKLPSAVGLGIALQMADGSTRVLRMSEALERRLQMEHTPFLLSSSADIHGAEVLRILLVQDRRLPLAALLNQTLGSAAKVLRTERIAVDTVALTPCLVSAAAMFNAVCPSEGWTARQLLVLANSPQLTELMGLAGDSAVPTDASAELRAAAAHQTVTDRGCGSAAEALYALVRAAEVKL